MKYKPDLRNDVVTLKHKLEAAEHELNKFKWISVDDRLPGIEVPVITLTDDYWMDMFNRISTSRRTELNKDGDWAWYAYMHNSMLTNVTHWMPLLEEPKL